MLKPSAIMTVGLPGSGKSSYAKQQRKDYYKLERDVIRKELYQNKFQKDFTWGDWDISLEPEVAEIYNKRLEDILKANVNIILTDTWLNRKYRVEMIKLLQEKGYDVTLVVFKIPMHICKERNARRGLSDKVPDIAYEKMARHYTSYCYTESKGYKQESIEFGYNVILATMK